MLKTLAQYRSAHRPKFGAGEGMTEDAASISEAFFRGIARHKDASAV